MINLMKNYVLLRLFGFYICLTVGIFIVHQVLFQNIEFIFSPFSDYANGIFFRLCNLLVLLLFIWQFHRHCNGISLAETTLTKKCNHQVVIGFGLLGMISLFLVAIVLWSLGMADHTFTEISAQNILQLLGLLFISAIFEQILINGVFLTSLSKKMRPGFALLLTGALFCYLHIDNRSYSVLAAINTFLAGCLFGAIFLKSQSIWPATAFHYCWNTTQSLLFGFNVSGNTFDSLMRTQLTGNSLVTGGHYGLEGSILTTMVNLAIILFLTKTLLFNQTNSQSCQAG